MSLVKVVNKVRELFVANKYNSKNFEDRLALFEDIYTEALSDLERASIPGKTDELKCYELSKHISDIRMHEYWTSISKNSILKVNYITKDKNEFFVIIADDTQPNDYITYLQNITDKRVIVISHDKIDKYRKSDIDLILFTGGDDVNPALYNEKVGSFTFINEKRDEKESNIFHKFEDTPKLGICRGGQFLTVMAGGKLIQHVENHNQSHLINIFVESPFDKNSLSVIDLSVTSSHHQMMYPFDLKKTSYEIIGFSKFHLSETYLNGDNEQIKKPVDFVECEIIYYPKINALCIQAHPEWMSQEDGFVKKTIELINEKLFKNEQ